MVGGKHAQHVIPVIPGQWWVADGVGSQEWVGNASSALVDAGGRDQ